MDLCHNSISNFPSRSKSYFALSSLPQNSRLVQFSVHFLSSLNHFFKKMELEIQTAHRMNRKQNFRLVNFNCRLIKGGEFSHNSKISSSQKPKGFLLLFFVFFHFYVNAFLYFVGLLDPRKPLDILYFTSLGLTCKK